MGGLRTLICATAAGAAFAAPTTALAQSADDTRAVRMQLVERVLAEIPGATMRDSADEPLVGVPGVAEVAAGRTAVMRDPAFWNQIVFNLLVSRTVVLPTPVDLVKPEAYLPTVPVANGGDVSPLPRDNVELRDVTYEWQGRTKTLAEFLPSTETDAVAFVHGGRIVTDLYANGWSADVRHQPWSVTKSFVSSLIGIAQAEGRIRSIEDPVDRYVRELRGTPWEGTTIRNVLEMESGMFWDEGTPVLAVNTQVEQWIAAALDLYTNGALGQGRNEFLKSMRREVPQGTKWRYNSGNTQVLAWVLESVYGKPFNHVISEKLWIPAGMAGDARVMTDRRGDAIASQGLYSRIFDLARFGELFRNGGRRPDGRRVVPAAWVGESTTMTALSEGEYAYQWWRGPTPESYEASGFQGQKISVSPANCLTGVRLSHTLGANLGSGEFAVEMGGDEWSVVYRAVAARLGGCAGAEQAQARRALRLTLGRKARFSRRAALRRGGLRVVVSTGLEPATVRLRAKGKGALVAVRRARPFGGGARAVTLRLTPRGRKLLRARRVVRLTVTGTARSADRVATARRRIVLR